MTTDQDGKLIEAMADAARAYLTAHPELGGIKLVTIKKNGGLKWTSWITTKKDDDDLCPRCGASMQLTHHWLCEARDGTPSGLSDDIVRKLIAAAPADDDPEMPNF